MQMLKPDINVIRRRDEIIAALREIVPEKVIVDQDDYAHMNRWTHCLPAIP